MLDLAADVLKKVPEEIDYEQTAKIMADDPSPLNVVLLQEVIFTTTSAVNLIQLECIRISLTSLDLNFFVLLS